MFDLIGTVMADKLSVKLNNVTFFSLFDGLNDATMLKKMSYVQYFDPTPLGSNKVKIIQEFELMSAFSFSKKWGREGGESEKLKKEGGSMVQAQVFLKGGTCTFHI